MTNIAFLAIGTAALLVGAWRAVRLSRVGGGRGLVITLLALGAALVLLSGSVQHLASMVYPSLGRLASNLCTLTAAYGVLITVSELADETPPRRRRRARLGTYVTAMALLVLTFFATSDLPSGLGRFGRLYDSHPTLVAYVAVYTLYLAVAVVAISRIVVVSLPSSRSRLRAGLVNLLLGCGLALAYLGYKAVSVARLALDMLQPSGSSCSNPVSSVSCSLVVAAPAASILTVVLGVVLISSGARRARRQALAELAVLRRAVRDRVPRVARHQLAHSHSRLVGTVVEICDGLLELGIDDQDDPETAARDLWRAEPVAPSTRTVEPPPVGDTIWTEVERLRPLARAYAALTAVH